MSSRETDAAVAYMAASGVPFKVTDIATPGVHARSSWHYVPGTNGTGCGIDFAGVTPSRDSISLRKIFDALDQSGDVLQELIYGGAPHFVNAGKRFPIRMLDPTVAAAHHNHVHVAFRPGRLLQWKGTPIVTPQTPPAPPEITTADFGSVACITVRCTLGENGEGYVDVPANPQRVYSVLAQGPYPKDNGYWNTPVFGKQDRNGRALVSITEGPANTPIEFYVWVIK